MLRVYGKMLNLLIQKIILIDNGSTVIKTDVGETANWKRHMMTCTLIKKDSPFSFAFQKSSLGLTTSGILFLNKTLTFITSCPLPVPSEIFGVYLLQSLKTGLLSFTSVINTTTTAVLVWIVLPPSTQQDPSSTAVTFNSYLSRSNKIGLECKRITPVISSITNCVEVVAPPTKPNLQIEKGWKKERDKNSKQKFICQRASARFNWPSFGLN